MLKKTIPFIMAFLIVFTSACAGKAVSASADQGATATGREKRQITDMAGRQVAVPANIETVYSTGQPGVVLLYTLCPDKLLGWCIKPSDDEKAFLQPKYLSLPVLGLMQGSNNTASKEELLGRKPDIILMVTELDSQAVPDAEALQSGLGIPVVVADDALDSLQKTYAFLGGLLNAPVRAKTLGDYSVKTLEDAKRIASTIPDSDKLSVYYAQGSAGLQTAPAGSAHSEVLDLVGGKNIVTLPGNSDGRVTVNMEQVLAWNPQVVIASYSMSHTGGMSNGTKVLSVIRDASDAWNQVQAIRNGLVFSVPCLPYNWLDMPPSANRLIGIKWLGNLLYPKYYDYDIPEETRSFYKLFYGVYMTDAQFDVLLSGAGRNH